MPQVIPLNSYEKITNRAEHKVRFKSSIGGTPKVEDKIINGSQINDIVLGDKISIPVGGERIVVDDIAEVLIRKYPYLIVKSISNKEVKAILKAKKQEKKEQLKVEKNRKIESLKEEIKKLRS